MKRWIAMALALALSLSLVSCGAGNAPAEVTPENSAGTSTAASAAPAEGAAGEYTYEEILPFGTVPWVLTLAEDGSYSLYVKKPNGMEYTYTGAYTVDGSVVTTGVPAEETVDIEAGFFNEDYSCDWNLNGDGTMTPVNEGAAGGIGGDFSGGMPGMMGGGAGSEDADFRAVSYASNSDAQVMDIYLPEQATGSDPVIVVVHGGGFKFGDQAMEIIRPIIEAGQKNGFVVASVDYRKSGEATFPGALSDVKAAVRYLRANAAEYGIDPEKVVLWGESAGAYLADMTALTPDVAELDGDVTDNAGVSSAVAAMVSFYAPVEFYTMDEEFIALGNQAGANHSVGSFETDYLGIPDMTADRDGVYRSWWGTYSDQVPAGLSAWIQAGTADANVPYTQSQNLADGLTGLGLTVRFGLIEGAAHEDAQFYTEQNLADIFAFLGEALG